jgi:D-cysteine desulfhydrase
VDRLAGRLDVDDAYVKMDAETGFALGGNKVRKLEFELAPARLDGVTCLITAGGPQSNHCRVTAAAAARLGLECVLVLNGPEPEAPTGNALLHRLFGAKIVTVEDRSDRVPTMTVEAERVSAGGGRALVLPIGASTGLGSLGYARCALELLEQLDTCDDDCEETALFVASSSCGTLGGLALGLALAGRTDVHLVGVSADASANELRDTSLSLARGGAALLGIDPSGADLTDRLRAIPLEADDTQVGEGYGIPTAAARAATKDLARLEGIVLDPTYSSKAAAGMIARVEQVGAHDGRRIVFLHTGGAPGLLA